MTYPIEENLPYAWLAIIVLAVFYAIYFAKMISQKRHGIQTHQIGRVKEKSVHRVEVLMSIANNICLKISNQVNQSIQSHCLGHLPRKSMTYMLMVI